MNKFLKIALILIGIGIVAGVITFFYVMRKPADSIADKKADFVIESKALQADFESKEAESNTKFLDKIIEVSGTVAEISADTTGKTIILREADAMSGVSCSFGKSQLEDIAAVKVGDNIKVKGLCAGYLMDVQLNKCALVK